MSTNYPNYSVYIQSGGQLKKPYNRSKRIEIFEKEKALHAAVKVWFHYNGHEDVVVLRFDRPYTATIVHYINRKDGSTSEHIL